MYKLSWNRGWNIVVNYSRLKVLNNDNCVNKCLFLFNRNITTGSSSRIFAKEFRATTGISFFKSSWSPKSSSQQLNGIKCNRKSTSSKDRDCVDEMEYVEGIVCKEGDIQDDEMKAFDLDEGKVLLVKQKGQLSAIGYKCSHYGAPLEDGALGDCRVRCPWHGACFNTTTGDIEDFPGLDSLPCYQVTIEKGMVKIRAKKSELLSNKRTKPMTAKSQTIKNTVVVIGGGPAAATHVETLRQEGFAGRIVMVAKEDYLPYDRVKVTKGVDFEIEKAQFRTREFYDQNGIEILNGTEATGVDFKKKVVLLKDNESLKYDYLFIATGSKAKKAQVEGADLANVVVMRDYTDSVCALKMLKPDKNIVVLGTSFIGLEMAAYSVDKVANVTAIGREDVPFKDSFGPEIGGRLMKLFQEKGVTFIMNSGMKKCIGKEGVLTAVELLDGTIIPADLCIMGIGAVPYTDFLKKSGLKCNENGTITTNRFMETHIKNVYAGGDIAHSPVFSNNNELAAIGHYGLAHYHGRIAALNIAGKKTESKAVPYFWTAVFGKSVRYTGHGHPHGVQIEGSLDELKFVAIFFDDKDKVIAMASIDRDPIVSQYAERLSQGKPLCKADLVGDAFAWAK